MSSTQPHTAPQTLTLEAIAEDLSLANEYGSWYRYEVVDGGLRVGQYDEDGSIVRHFRVELTITEEPAA